MQRDLAKQRNFVLLNIATRSVLRRGVQTSYGNVGASGTENALGKNESGHLGRLSQIPSDTTGTQRCPELKPRAPTMRLAKQKNFLMA